MFTMLSLFGGPLGGGTLVNVSGILLGAAGLVLLYICAPAELLAIDGGAPATDYRAIAKDAGRRRVGLRVGFGLSLFGIGLQFVALFLS